MTQNLVVMEAEFTNSRQNDHVRKKSPRLTFNHAAEIGICYQSEGGFNLLFFFYQDLRTSTEFDLIIQNH